MLKKILLHLLIIFSILPALAIEEIQLENDNGFLDRLSDIYYGKVSNEKEISPALRIFSKDGLKFDNSFINSVKLTFLFDNSFTYNKTGSETPFFKSKMTTIEPMITVKFNDNKTKFMFDYNLTRDLAGYDNKFTEKISQFYISHQITPEQTILIGQGARVPVNFDGSRALMQNETILKSQTGRTFGDSMSMGIRNIAEYKYLEYDIGLYDSTRYMKNFGRGADFTGFAVFKPFAGAEGELYKNFKTGAGFAIGKNENSYRTYDLYASYDYKKFHAKAEYTNADGYNGIYSSNNRADGFYILASYDITPKLSVLAKYDYFTPDKHKSRNYTVEYTAGITYKLYKNMKLLANYVNRKNSAGADSNMLLFALRFII